MRFILLIALTFFITSTHAQKMSWRKHAKLAKKLFEEKEYAEAAKHFESAWQMKTKKKELIYQAGECYFKVKDYKKAAEAYQYVKEDNDDFELPGLKYGRALKMSGQYDEASRAFVYFINGYQGKDKDVVASIIQDEIRGCELGMSLLESGNSSEVTVEHLSDNINSNQCDFAPVSFAEDILYFSSNMVGETKMYLSQRHGGVWSRARVPKNFPNIKAEHFGNGVFSPDNQRFFYTQCNGIDITGRMFEGCKIYVTQKNGDGWSAPEKLRAYINKKESTATHPFVVHQDGKEILYFVSDRSGGEGGMDIWVTSRDLASSEMDFVNPKNLGSKINSMGDEITPYFDEVEKVLYFSSNGGANIGGFDILKSENKGNNIWGKPQNMGFPFNSSADDYYYRPTKDSPMGFIVSNRTFGVEKTTSMDDDIFIFSLPDERYSAAGSIINGENGKMMKDANVSIYEITPEGKVRVLENNIFEDGQYEFALLPGKKYRIECEMDGFKANGVDLNTIDDKAKREFVRNIALEKADPIVEQQMNAGELDGEFSNPQPTGTMGEEEDIASSGDNSDNSVMPSTGLENTNEPETETGVAYKIQLIAVREYKESHPRFAQARNYGHLETEYLGSVNLTRVLLSGFRSKTDAEEVLEEMRQNRDFRKAIVVRYENGVRIDPWAK